MAYAMTIDEMLQSARSEFDAMEANRTTQKPPSFERQAVSTVGNIFLSQYNTVRTDEEAVVTVAPEQLIYAAQRMLGLAQRAIESGDRHRADVCLDIARRDIVRAREVNEREVVKA